MKIQKVAAERLNPAAYNPRKDLKPSDAEYKKLKRSIEEFGYVEPILWNERTGNIVGGHQRFKILLELGETEIDCVVVDFDDQREKALNVALNKIQGEWDETKLAELFRGFDLADFDAELTGFSIGEIDAMFAPKGCVEDDFDEDKAKQEVEGKGGAVTQSGDVWLLGDHRLICGDSTLLETFEALLEGKRAQLCVTSPPYGCGKDYEQKSLEPWFELMKPAIRNITKNADIVVLNLGDMFNTGGQYIEPTFCYCIEMLAESGYRPLWIRIWDKKRQALSSNAPYHLATNKPVGDAEWLGAFGKPDEQRTDELVVLDDHGYIVAAAGHNYKFVKRLTREEKREWGFSSLWRIASVQGGNPKNSRDERNHKARYPVELAARGIKMHSDKGGIVLEPFCGSGTDIIACEQLGRVCYAIEKEPSYVEIAVARWEKFTGEKAVKVEAGV